MVYFSKKILNKVQKALKVALFENFPHSNALATHLGPKIASNKLVYVPPFNVCNLESSDLAAL